MIGGAATGASGRTTHMAKAIGVAGRRGRVTPTATPAEAEATSPRSSQTLCKDGSS